MSFIHRSTSHNNKRKQKYSEYSDSNDDSDSHLKRHRSTLNDEMKKNQADSMDCDASVVRIPPYHFIHVLDQTTNVTRVEIGPQTFVRKDNEKVLMGATKMVIVPPRHFCVIKNPVARDDEGEIVRDVLGQVRFIV